MYSQFQALFAAEVVVVVAILLRLKDFRQKVFWQFFVS
jgi:hypothetical protein